MTSLHFRWWRWRLWRHGKINVYPGEWPDFPPWISGHPGQGGQGYPRHGELVQQTLRQEGCH